MELKNNYNNKIKRKYRNITYGGVTQHYIYIGSMGNDKTNVIHLYNGIKKEHEHTLSHVKLEELLEEKNNK